MAIIELTQREKLQCECAFKPSVEAAQIACADAFDGVSARISHSPECFLPKTMGIGFVQDTESAIRTALLWHGCVLTDEIRIATMWTSDDAHTIAHKIIDGDDETIRQFSDFVASNNDEGFVALVFGALLMDKKGFNWAYQIACKAVDDTNRLINILVHPYIRNKANASKLFEAVGRKHFDGGDDTTSYARISSWADLFSLVDGCFSELRQFNIYDGSLTSLLDSTKADEIRDAFIGYYINHDLTVLRRNLSFYNVACTFDYDNSRACGQIANLTCRNVDCYDQRDNGISEDKWVLDPVEHVTLSELESRLFEQRLGVAIKRYGINLSELPDRGTVTAIRDVAEEVVEDIKQSMPFGLQTSDFTVSLGGIRLDLHVESSDGNTDEITIRMVDPELQWSYSSMRNITTN